MTAIWIIMVIICGICFAILIAMLICEMIEAHKIEHHFDDYLAESCRIYLKNHPEVLDRYRSMNIREIGAALQKEWEKRHGK